MNRKVLKNSSLLKIEKLQRQQYAKRFEENWDRLRAIFKILCSKSVLVVFCFGYYEHRWSFLQYALNCSISGFWTSLTWCGKLDQLVLEDLVTCSFQPDQPAVKLQRSFTCVFALSINVILRLLTSPCSDCNLIVSLSTNQITELV